jgi:dihydroorotase
VTAAVSAHHFSLNENAVADYRTFAKISPPLRSESDREKMVEYLSNGAIDVIVSDHAPHDQDSKRVPFSQAENGIVGLETMFPLSMELFHNGRLSLLDLLAKITVNPAKLVGLQAGELKKGAAADLTLFDPDAPWTIKVSDLKSKSQNAPYDNRPVQGRILKTWVNGRLAFNLNPDS